MRQASKFLELISKIALGIFILFILLGIYFAFYPKVKDREKYKEIYLSNERKIEDLVKKEKKPSIVNIVKILQNTQYVLESAQQVCNTEK